MHKFKYPLLYIGIPLDFTGSIGSLLSVRGVEKDEEDAAPKKFTFFTLDPTTYLEPELPFKTKLQPVLAYHVRRNVICGFNLMLTMYRAST